MVSSFRKTQAYLYALQYRGMKLGLRNIRVLLSHAGNPQKNIKTIHVAGTNGKGSTSSLIASILMEAGLKTGLYTSPHLVRFPERIRIDGREVSESRIIEYVRQLVPAIEETRATFFEATTCVAFQYFADEEVDVAVIETGLGGRLDATNVLKPLVSVITSLSMDHVDVLGETLVSIAREKGGIIKTGVPCVTSTQDPDALRALDRIGRRRGTTVDRSWKNVRISEDPRDRRRIRLEGKVFHTGFLRLGLEGEHQRENARIALRACEIVHRSRSAPGARITDEAIERGLVRVRQNTGLRGRSEEIICEGVRVLLDVGHNVDGIRALTDSLKARGFRSPIVLFGALQDKDVAGMVKLLAKTAGHIIGVVPPTKRALGIKGLARIMRQQSIPFTAEGSVRKGFRRALDLARGRAGLVVTGSHYLVGEVIPLLELRKKKPRPA